MASTLLIKPLGAINYDQNVLYTQDSVYSRYLHAEPVPLGQAQVTAVTLPEQVPDTLFSYICTFKIDGHQNVGVFGIRHMLNIYISFCIFYVYIKFHPTLYRTSRDKGSQPAKKNRRYVEKRV
jgi:hypothetical protein